MDASFQATLEKLPSGTVYQTVVQPDGKILVAGNFRVIDDVARTGIARLNPDGSLDPTFNPPDLRANNLNPLSPTVYAIELLTNGKVLIGGSFALVAGSVRQGVARLNPDGSFDPTFNQTAGGNLATLAGTVYALEVQSDGKVLVGGTFNHSSTRHNLVRLGPDGEVDGSFFAGTVGDVNKILVQPDGKIVFVGGRTSPLMPRLDRLNSDGSDDMTFSTNSFGGGGIFALARQSDGKLLIGGEFDSVNGFTQIRYLARFDQNGVFDTSFNTNNAGPNFEVNAIDFLSTGKIVVGGRFSTYNGVSRNKIALLNPDGTLDKTFNHPETTETIFSLTATANDNVLVGRAALDRFGVSRNSALVKLDAQGLADDQFLPVFGTNGSVYRTKVQPDGKIIAVGGFNQANGAQRIRIARFNPDGTLDPSFDPMIYTTLSPFGDFGPVALQADGKILIDNFRLNQDGSVDDTFVGTAGARDIEVQSDGKILYAGTSLVRRNPDGSVDNTFSANPSALVYNVLVQPDGKILICGSFTQVNGVNRGGIARLNSDGSIDNSFNPPGGANGFVYNIDLQSDGKILLVGGFTAVNFDTNHPRVARLNADGTLDNSFTGKTDNETLGLKVLANGKILIGGKFQTVNNAPQSYYALLNPDGSLDPTFNSGIGANDYVWEINQQTDGQILLGGAFSQINGRSAIGIARLSNAGGQSGTPFDYDGDGKTDVSIFRPGPGEWWYLRSSDGGNRAFQFGSSTDKLVPADFTGDGSTDIAFWRESTGEWFVLRSEDSSFYSFPFGTTNDIPVPADYDGDGKADPAIFRPSSATWFIIRSTDGGTTIAQFGANTDLPVPADYDGDGKADLAIFRPGDGSWWLNRSTAGLIVYNFGTGTDRTVPGDYTGDGKADVAFWRPTTGEWFILRSEDASFYSGPFGAMGDVPVPGDYDGDGRSDLAVFRPSVNTWFIDGSTVGFSAVSFGIAGDAPTPSAYVR
ncbi:MAG: hypothetical protein R2747_20065 [Pyrinomonadaceae bacterium]